MPLTEEFIELLRRPTEEITSTINQEFFQANDHNPVEILRFVGDPYESFEKLDPKCKSNVIDERLGGYSSFEKFSDGDAETFKEMHKKASDVFKHVFTFLDRNQKQEVISGNKYELFYLAAESGSFPQVNFLIEEARELEQETGQEILQPMISARNYQGFLSSIWNTYGLGYEEEMRQIYKLILASVSEENHLPMITSGGDAPPLLRAVRNDYVDLVEHIFENVPENQLREAISSTMAYNEFPYYESNQAFGMVLQKDLDLGVIQQTQAAILNNGQQNQDNSSESSNEAAKPKFAEPEIITESVASEEVNSTSKVPANEESKPSSQIENPKASNLKMSQQNQDNSSENPNESNDKKPRIR